MITILGKPYVASRSQKKKKKKVPKISSGCNGRMTDAFYFLIDSFLYVQTCYNKHKLTFRIRNKKLTKISRLTPPKVYIIQSKDKE